MKLYSLSDLLSEPSINKEKLFNALKGFKSINKTSNNFLCKKAVNFESKHLCRTYIGLNNNKIDYFFSIALTSIKKESIQQKTLDAMKMPQEKTHLPVFLLAQIAKDQTNKIEGKKIMKQALGIIFQIQAKVGGSFIVLDAIKEQKIIELYESFNFRTIEEEEKTIKMIHYIAPIPINEGIFKKSNTR